MSDPSSQITAAEYGRRQSPPISKSGMSRLIKLGLPTYDGSDDHGRICKFVLPHEADQWRIVHCTPKMDGNGQLRGLPAADAPPSRHKAMPSAPGRLPARAPEAPTTHPAAEARDEGASGADALSTAGLSVSQRIAEARAQEAEDRAASARLRRLKEEGALVDRDVAIEVQLEFVGMVGTTVDRMAADNATLLSAQLGVTEHDAYRALQEVARKLRTDLARSSDTAYERARALGGSPTVGRNGQGDHAQGEDVAAGVRDQA